MNASRLPVVVGGLLDVDCSDDIIKNLVLISAALVVGGTVRHAAWPARLHLPARVDVDRAL